jgi:hypothetical protein
MQGTTEEAPIPVIPMENERNGGRMSVRRKFANMLMYFNNPFSTMPTPPQDEDAPAAKKPRLEASTAVDEEQDIFFDAHMADTLSASPGDTVAVVPTDVTVAATSLPRSQAPRARAPPRKWKPEEDSRLTEAIMKHGGHWLEVAMLVPGRTNKQCRKRWTDNLEPIISQTRNAHVKRKMWTVEEDAQLTAAVKKHGNNWVEVAALIPCRTKAQQCTGRGHRCFDLTTARATPHMHKGKMTPEEEAMLTEAVMEHGNDWVQVLPWIRIERRAYHPPVSSKIDRDFGPQHHKRGKWTPEEDANFTEAVRLRWIETLWTPTPYRKKTQI